MSSASKFQKGAGLKEAASMACAHTDTFNTLAEAAEGKKSVPPTAFVDGFFLFVFCSSVVRPLFLSCCLFFLRRPDCSEINRGEAHSRPEKIGPLPTLETYRYTENTEQKNGPKEEKGDRL